MRSFCIGDRMFYYAFHVVESLFVSDWLEIFVFLFLGFRGTASPSFIFYLPSSCVQDSCPYVILALETERIIKKRNAGNLWNLAASAWSAGRWIPPGRREKSSWTLQPSFRQTARVAVDHQTTSRSDKISRVCLFLFCIITEIWKKIKKWKRKKMVLKRRKKTVHVKQKIKPPKLWKKPKYHKFDDQVKKNWAIKSSTAKNYSTFGISTDPNKTISRALKKQNSPFSFISREEAGEALPEKQTAVTQKHGKCISPEPRNQDHKRH